MHQVRFTTDARSQKLPAMTHDSNQTESSRSPPSEFANLALLLRFLVLINSKTGSATINSALSEHPSPDAWKQTEGISALEGAAAILVQDHEIIATTVTGLAAVVASQSTSGSRNQGAPDGTDLDIQAIDPSSTQEGKRCSLNFTAVPNPEHDARKEGTPESKAINPHNLRVLNPGSSLLDAIKEYQWAYALK
jgi:hypothetical protein